MIFCVSSTAILSIMLTDILGYSVISVELHPGLFVDHEQRNSSNILSTVSGARRGSSLRRSSSFHSGVAFLLGALEFGQLSNLANSIWIFGKTILDLHT
jgi:hypothetical protein